MGQDAAQTLIDMRDKVEGWAQKFGSGNGPLGKADPSWHNDMVKQANESFRKAAQRKASDDPKLGGQKKKSAAANKKAVAKKRQ
jgi:hypothetical protein